MSTKVQTERYVRGICKICGETLRVVIGDLDLGAVKESLRKRRPYQCPGGGLTPHCELGDVLSGYDWDWTIIEDAPLPSDDDHIKKLQADGQYVLCGHAGACPNLPNLHDVTELKHVGFGDFEDATYRYCRADSPTGSRFYVRYPKSGDQSNVN